MSKVDAEPAPDITPEIVKELLEEGRKAAEKTRWRSSPRSDLERLEDRVRLLELRLMRLEEAVTTQAPRADAPTPSESVDKP